MSGGGKGVCTALAISNAITNLSATVFGQLWRLEPLVQKKFQTMCINRKMRYDLTEGLKKLQCRTLISVGENFPFHSEALHMCAKMDKKFNALVEVQACGSLVIEEQPHAMLIPIEYFLMGYGFYRPPPRLFCSYGTSPSPTSPLSPSCISAELLSPESLDLKLKPIKTRVAAMDD